MTIELDHAAVVSRVGDLFRGKLPEEERVRVAGHLSACHECHALSDTYLTLAWGEGGVAHGSTHTWHPTVEELVGYATAADRLDRRVRARIRRHVELCPSCRLELDGTIAAERELGSYVPSLARSRRVTVAAVVATGVALAALSVGLVIKMSPLSEGVDAVRLGETWSGPVELNPLRSPLRSSDRTHTIHVDPAQPSVPLAVIPGLDPEIGDDEVLRFAVHGAHDRAVWSRELRREEVEAYARGSGAITFLVPTNALREGPLRLRVTRVAESTILFEVPFALAELPLNASPRPR